VRAVNAAGASVWSNRAAAATLAFPPPAPKNLTATAITFQRIDLAWSPVDEADHYEVQQSTDGVTFATIAQPIVTQMMIFGLQSSSTHFFRVRAVNSGGPSPWSNVAIAATLAENQPAAPNELSAVAQSRILLEWRDNSVNETRFEIQRSTGGGPFARASQVRTLSGSPTVACAARRPTRTGCAPATGISARPSRTRRAPPRRDGNLRAATQKSPEGSSGSCRLTRVRSFSGRIQ
jgi:hypothetical protein